jgi:hypothetical protein
MDGEDSSIWMTKAELAHVRGIDLGSASRLIRRKGWRRQPGNDGRVRVLVPADWAQPRGDGPWDDEQADPTDSAAGPTDNPTDGVEIAAAIEAVMSALREGHAGEVSALRETVTAVEAKALVLDQARAAAEQARVQAEARADRAEAALAGERNRADALRASLENARVSRQHAREAQRQAEAAAQAALQAADALNRADMARRGKGRLARTLAAWRGA